MNNHKRSHEKQENSWFTSKLAPSGLPLQGWGRFSRTSFDLSSSKGAWQPRKMEKNERKWKKGGSSGETAAPVSLLPKEVIDCYKP